MPEILIRGRSCRLPGAPDVTAFEKLLFDGRCAVTEIPSDRWDKRTYLHPDQGVAGKAYTFSAGVLDDVFGFDPQAFGLSPREAAQMDPQQRFLLEVVWEALEDAGIRPSDIAGQHVGVYVGASSLDYSRRLGMDRRDSDAYMMTGNTLSLVSNRVSHVFDLRGPSMTIDTACSSSLVALNEAMKAINAGIIDMAIVAGSNALLDPTPFAGFSAARMLSPTGLCQPFSANADGYVRAEGAVAFVLHRTDRPTEYPSYASLVDVETNADGRTVNVALPSSEGQRVLLESLYERAEVDPNWLAFVEAHGTGTLVGDPVEAEALGRALGQHRDAPLLFGSVKSNIGHLEPASGVAGILKMLATFEAGALPPSLHAAELNPNIPFERFNLELARQTTPLAPMEGRWHAGISSFGFGGTNVHAILKAPEPLAVAADDGHAMPAAANRAPILMTSAFSRDALEGLVAAHRAVLGDSDLAAEDRAAYLDAAALHRDTYPVRLAIAADDAATTNAAMADFLAERKNPAYAAADTWVTDAPPVFAFSGNGSQFSGMSRAALATDPVYAEKFAKIDALFGDLSGVSLLALVESDDLTETLAKVEVAQPLLFADQIATTAALRARGLVPAAAIGHSGGEVAAAWCAGALDLETAVRLTYERAYSQIALHGRGTMAALQVSEAEARQALDELGDTGIDIAAVNSPRSISLVGPTDAITDFIRWAKRTRRWAAVRVKVEYPYHSSVQDEIEADLRARLAFIAPKETTIPFISSVTGKVMDGTELGADYWWANVRQPVRFMDGIEAARDAGYLAFVEIGPQPVLASYLKASLGDAASDCVITHSANKSDTTDSVPMRAAYLRAVSGGCQVRSESDPVAARRAIRALPTYPFQHTDFRADQSPDVRRYYGATDHIGVSLGGREMSGEPIWTIDLDPRLAPELADHVVGDTAVVPGAVYLDAALLAAKQVLGSDGVELRDLDIVTPLPLVKGTLTEMKTQIDTHASRVTIASRARTGESAWRDHVSARIGKLISGADTALVSPDLTRQDGDRDGALLYAAARQVGIQYGPAFQRVTHLRSRDDDTIEVVLSPSPYEDRADIGAYAIDPIALDAVFHGLIARLVTSQHAPDRLGFVPVHVSRMRLYKTGAKIRAGRVSTRRVGARSILADFDCFDDQGDLVARLDGVRFRAVRLFKPVDFRHHAYVSTLAAAEMLPGAADAGLAAPADLAAQVLARAQDTSFAPDDDTFVLIEAIAQRVAFDVLSTLRAEDGRIAFPRDLDAERATYLVALFENLSELDLAREQNGAWQLDADCDLPEAAELLEELIGERPDLGAEYGLLATVRRRLAGWISGDVPWDAGELLGRAALDNVRTGSSFAQRRARLLSDALAGVLIGAGTSRALKVAELTDGPVPALRALDRSLPDLSMALYRITPAGEGADGGLGPEDLAINRPLTDLTATAEDLEKHGPFDLVICAGTLRAFDEDADVLAALKPALAAGGALVAVEDTPSSFREMIWGIGARWFRRSMGPDFPVGDERSLEDIAVAFRDVWGDDASVADLPDGFANAALIVARGATVAPDADPVAPSNGDFAAVLTTDTDGYSVAVDAATGIEMLTPTGDAPVICHIPQDPDADATDAISARIGVLQAALADWTATAKRVWVYLPGGAGHVGAAGLQPAQAALWAFLRTAQNETPALELTMIDRAAGLSDAAAADAVVRLIDHPSAETEIVLGETSFAAVRVAQGLPALSGRDAAVADARGTKLTSDAAGTLDDLSWRSVPRTAPGRDEVEVEIVATGLNYRDVMWAQGLLPEEALETGFAGPTLGIECAGRVSRVGADVVGLAVGDPVVTFGPGCFASHMTMHSDFVGRMPEDIDLAAAATIPVAFFTAYYAMMDLARLGPDDTILIHGGAGGVGLAAIQIAQAVGARVIATAGSAVKQEVLRELGVAHILSSRTLDFVDGVERITEGQGVDVVLNSLAGEAMERSLNLLKPFGRFLELGKQDFYANTGIGLRPLKENVSYFGIDVDQLLAARPTHARALFADMIERFRDGTYRPLPYRLFDSGAVVEAFRVMQRSAHLGKIVVSPARPSVALPDMAAPVFAATPDGWHVVIGGLGGLGIALAEWLAGAGASRIALTSRTGKAAPDVAARIELLRGQGVDVRIETCDVADATATGAMLADLRTSAPIRGVIHSAMVLDDKAIQDLTPEGLARTLPAKVAGIDNLDAATRADTLDYFVGFSSIATMVGNHGQSAYVAANAYVEAVIQRRKLTGLPGLAVGWGPITDAGYLSREEDKAKMIRKITGNADFTVQQALHALERLLARAAQGIDTPAVVTVSPMGWSGMVAALPLLKGPTYAKLAALGRSSGDGGDFEDLRGALLEMSAEKAEARLTVFLTQEIARILRVPENTLSPTRAVSDFGMDSLMGVELGLASQRALGDDVPMMSISDELSIRDIARKIIGHLHGATGEAHLSGVVGNLAAQHLGSYDVSAPADSDGAHETGGAETGSPRTVEVTS